jgi:hypothetical protein
MFVQRSDEDIRAMSVAEFRAFVQTVPDADKERYRKLRLQAARFRYALRKREQNREEAAEAVEWRRSVIVTALGNYAATREERMLMTIGAFTEKMSRRELAALLESLPEAERRLFRELRRKMQLRYGQAAYREAHREQERRRALDHYHAKMDELRQHPKKLAEHRAAEKERKRRERAAKRES